MARKSKLNDKQWAEVDRRLLDGETPAAIAKDYPVTPTAIRQRKLSTTDEIKDVANQIVTAERALAALPITSQITAQSFASKLRAMSDNMLSAASLGAATSHRLAALANAQVAKVDDVDPMQSQDVLKSVAVLTDMSNRAGEPAMKLIVASSKDGGMKPPGEDQERRLGELSDDELVAIATSGA